MGAGLALEFKLRYPDMMTKYIELCESKAFDIGKLWIYKGSPKNVLNFPTKKHWKDPTKEEFLHLGLQKFLDTYQQRQIKSIAFPLLGAGRGGIPAEKSLSIMQKYLANLTDLEVEVYRYSPTASDDLFNSTKTWLLSHSPEEIKADTGMSVGYAKKLIEAVQAPEIVQVGQLASIPGIGIKTMEKLFSFIVSHNQEAEQKQQQSLGI